LSERREYDFIKNRNCCSDTAIACQPKPVGCRLR
jgi:hypothetical protein